MTIVGASGHQALRPGWVPYIAEGIRAVLRELPDPIVGICSLAAGADQLFAGQVLAAHGRLHAVIPAQDYATTMSGPDLARYHELLSSADEVTVLGFATADETSYSAAGEWIVERAELLLAVWDGLPARGRGGTGDVVAHAHQIGVPVRIVWPPGAQR